MIILLFNSNKFFIPLPIAIGTAFFFFHSAFKFRLSPFTPHPSPLTIHPSSVTKSNTVK